MNTTPELHQFCAAVNAVVEKQYGYEDGGDACWSLIEQGVLNTDFSVNEAARAVAQVLEQA